MQQNKYPVGWDTERVEQLLAYYEEQTEEEAVAEDEATFRNQTLALMEIPFDLVPAVRGLLAKYYGGNKVPA